ncbi:MAG TPA: DUF1800 domain-containing protein [Thermoanaerobaculia bacterium]|nr:DUF1800 domain-containing protein [Thermoanaerobaculia bacterium]
MSKARFYVTAAAGLASMGALAVLSASPGAPAPAKPATAAAPQVPPPSTPRTTGTLAIPWREAGWTEREAAAHLLDRFTFGPRPGDVDRVVATGLERWFEQQVAGGLPEPVLTERLGRYHALTLSGPEIARTYPNPFLVARQAEQAGVVDRQQMEQALTPDEEPMSGEQGREQRQNRRAVMRYGMEQGYRSQRELIAEQMGQKLDRAVLAENQLAEVLVDFWFNHFYVSLTDNEARSYVLAYERDAIRPHVLGTFGAMLGASARHPAMLLYLDNARSTANEGAPTTFQSRRGGAGEGGFGRRGGFSGGMGRELRGRGGFGPEPGTTDGLGAGRGPAGPPGAGAQGGQRRRSTGLNENYARELLELHTLGVDGGYSQKDVVEVARAFTGWSVVPPMLEAGNQRRLARARQAGSFGFVVEGDFLFRADAHDAGEKLVLGRKLAAGRGIEDGREVLDLVALHPATAKHLAKKLATRFVADAPPAALVDRLAARFLATHGDLSAVMRTLVESPEFWHPVHRGAKIKSPFELAVSAVRATGARVLDGAGLVEWIGRMGQPLYLYQAPTGYPDRADAWVNTGSLLNRMNFGLALAAGRIGGVSLDLAALNGGREPESREEALALYLPRLLPERDLDHLAEELSAAIRDPDLSRKVAERSERESGGGSAYGALFREERRGEGGMDSSPYGRLFAGHRLSTAATGEPSALEQVVGVILGAPEFQRR